MGGLAACAGGAGIGALAFLALRGLLAFGAFFAKARKARSARSVAARSVASATRQFTDAAADSLRVDGGRCGASGSVSERRKAFVAGKYSSVVAILPCGSAGRGLPRRGCRGLLLLGPFVRVASLRLPLESALVRSLIVLWAERKNLARGGQ